MYTNSVPDQPSLYPDGQHTLAFYIKCVPPVGLPLLFIGNINILSQVIVGLAPCKGMVRAGVRACVSNGSNSGNSLTHMLRVCLSVGAFIT